MTTHGGGKRYAAYGSNLNLNWMASRCPRATVIGNGTLNGYQLVFQGSSHGALATVEPMAGGRVPVMLWEITPECEDALDHYEGWPILYRKATVEVTCDGETETAMAYIMNEGRVFGEPAPSYFLSILEGYVAAGFPVRYLIDAYQLSIQATR